MARDVKLTALSTSLGLILGAFISYAISSHFASKATEEAVAKAIQKGREEGYSDGFLAANEEFEKFAPAKLEAKFQPTFDAIRREARAAGFAAGATEGKRFACGEAAPTIRREGYDEGYSVGFVDGTARGRTACMVNQLNEDVQMEAARRNWRSYLQLLHRLNDAVEALEKDPGNQQLQSELLASASAVEEVAGALEDSYSNQAASFNSIMDELRLSLENRNFPEIRRVGRALFQSSEAKGSLFMSGNRQEFQTFLGLSR